MQKLNIKSHNQLWMSIYEWKCTGISTQRTRGAHHVILGFVSLLMLYQISHGYCRLTSLGQPLPKITHPVGNRTSGAYSEPGDIAC